MTTRTSCETCSKPLAGRGKCKSNVHRDLGPQQVGGIYRNDKWTPLYTVLAIEERTNDWMGWAITCVDLPAEQQPANVRHNSQPGRVRRHCTAWNSKYGIVVSDPAT